MDPLEGELAHLAFLSEEFETERLRHERTLRNLTARKQRAEHRLRMLVWERSKPGPFDL